MFHQMALKNFKGWQTTGGEPLRLAPITLFFGSNSSGKTSLLQSILLLKQTAESRDRRRVLHPGDKRALVDLGTPRDLIFKHALDQQLEFRFAWDLPGGIKLHKDFFTELTFTLKVGFRKEGQSYVEVMRYYLNQMANVAMLRRKDGTGYDLACTGLQDVKKLELDPPAVLPDPVRFYGFPDEARSFVDPSAWLVDLGLQVEKQLDRVQYVGPLREYPERSYLFAGDAPPDVGIRGEQAVHAILAAGSEGRQIVLGHGAEKREVPFAAGIAEWLKAFDVIDSFKLEPIAPGSRDYAVRVKRTPDAAEVFITDVGFGVSQVLPVLVQCYYAARHSTVLFEQPEIHLHPCVQARLSDVFIDAAKNSGVQFIIESHSEHLLRRLQRRVAEGETVRSDEVALYVCDIDGGRSRIRPLEMDEYGNITNWPKDFFGDEVGDLIKMTEATMRRQGVEP